MGFQNYVKGSFSKERISLFSQIISSGARGNALGCIKEGFNWVLGTFSSWKESSSIGTGYPGTG